MEENQIKKIKKLLSEGEFENAIKLLNDLVKDDKELINYSINVNSRLKRVQKNYRSGIIESTDYDVELK